MAAAVVVGWNRKRRGVVIGVGLCREARALAGAHTALVI